jgi:hypothetical protein
VNKKNQKTFLTWWVRVATVMSHANTRGKKVFNWDRACGDVGATGERGLNCFAVLVMKIAVGRCDGWIASLRSQ